MDDLTPNRIAGLKSALVATREELERLLRATLDGTRPVELDEPIGRLTRMDAIQQQKMATANRSSHDLRLRQVIQALEAMAQGRYGACRRCDDPIGYPRLEARPESSFCIECQDEIDRNHG